MLLVSDGGKDIPEPARKYVERIYTIPVGVPSRLLSDYPAKNARLLQDAASVSLTGALDTDLDPEPADSQKLELSRDLRQFMTRFTKDQGENNPVTMLNLLCFKKDGKEGYATYGKV